MYIEITKYSVHHESIKNNQLFVILINFEIFTCVLWLSISCTDISVISKLILNFSNIGMAIVSR